MVGGTAVKTATTGASDLLAAGRLDAAYFLDAGYRIRRTLSASTIRSRSVDSLGDVYAPSRFKRTYAVPGEASVSYLRPYDVFEFLPPEADKLSATRTAALSTYMIRDGDILQTCSGRNLGPVTIADSYLAQFALSHDMIRIRVDDETDRLYLLAFLRSDTGQSLLRNDRGGSVISHITTGNVGALNVPFVEEIAPDVVDAVRRAISLRQAARTTLVAAIRAINTAYPVPSSDHSAGWTVSATRLSDRLDAAFHSDQVEHASALLINAGGVRLREVAAVQKPGGRHKMVYVEPGKGTPLLSGRQILQADPVALKHLSRHTTHTATDFALSSGTVIFQADGRAEESLGYPVVVTQDRDGWLASGHVGRALPKNPADAGWLWASLASDVVRTQVTAQSTGSVVDALDPADLQDVVLPPRETVDSLAILDAWADMAEASKLLTEASELVDAALRPA